MCANGHLEQAARLSAFAICSVELSGLLFNALRFNPAAEILTGGGSSSSSSSSLSDPSGFLTNSNS